MMTMTKMWWPTMAMTTLKIETLEKKVLTMYLGRFAFNWSLKMGINCGSSFKAVTNFIWVTEFFFGLICLEFNCLDLG